MPDDQAIPPQPETPQTPVSEALPEPIAPAPSEPTPALAVEQPAPTPQAETASESAQPISEVVSEPTPPSAEPVQNEPVEVPEVEVETPRSAASAASSAPPSPTPSTSPQTARELLVKARAKIQTKKQQKLEKILRLFDAKEKITNDDVEKLLHCSDATALRYLNELMKQGKIQRIGKTGAGVEYTKI